MNDFRIKNLIKAVSGRVIQGNTDLAVNGISIDSRTLEPGDLFFALKGLNFDGHRFVSDALNKGASGIVVSDKIDSFVKDNRVYKNKLIIEVENTLRALHDWAKHIKKKYKTYNICITGSTGKTTTKELAASILSLKGPLLKTEGNYNNEIGIPLTLFKLKDYHEMLIAEMGMRGLGEIKELTDMITPDLAIITNVGLSHIGLLGSKENIFKAKSELILSLKKDGVAVLNRDDAYYDKMINLVKNKKNITFGINEGGDASASDIEIINGKKMNFNLKVGNQQAKITSFPLLGIHNVYNVLAASAAAFALGVDIEMMVRGLKSFKSLSMRMQPIEFGDDNYLLNDSYNASPSSLKNALSTFSKISRGKRKIAILGDMLELGKMTEFYHRQIGADIVNLKIDILFTLGKKGKLIAQSAMDHGMPRDCVFSFEKDKELLSEKILSQIKPMDILLLKGSRGMEMEEIQKYITKRYKK